METSGETSNWIPTFSGTSETGDSICSFQSAPGSSAVDPQSDDRSFDAISRQKLNLVEPSTPPKNTTPAPPISMFEEDTRSSWSVEPPKQAQAVYEESQNLSTPIQPFKEVIEEELQDNTATKPHDEESQNSIFLKPPDEESQNSPSSAPPKLASPSKEAPDEESQGSMSLKPNEEESQNNVFLKPQEEESQNSPKEAISEEGPQKEEPQAFPPEGLFEYMWPQEGGEFFLLQEQICDYLGIKSFKRKHPDLARRPVEMGEKQHLRERGVVSEMQCDLGLTALRSEEVLELMSRDYPERYSEYIRVLREREQHSITEKHREYAATNADKTKMVDLVRKAVQSAAEYNAHLNQERREERRSCMDLQTFTIHYPKTSKPKSTTESTKPGKYPVALLPGQFQDYYKEYSSDELKYLPVNTVLYGPLKELQSVESVSSDSEDSSASDGSCCSSSHEDSSSGSEEKGSESSYKPKIKPNAICKVCKRSSNANSKDEMLHCSECENSAHPACIELSVEVVEVLRTYPWQCTDCKVCSQCRDPNDEDKMLFCDTCDRGYHTFCVGLKALPTGKWVCRRCGACSGCGATRPGDRAQWQYEAAKGEDTRGARPKIFCQACFRKKR